MKLLKLYIIIISLLISTNQYAQAIDNVHEVNLMSVYIYNFTKFLEWPDNDSENFYIYVYGDKDILTPLRTIAEKETIKTKRIIVDYIVNLDSIKANSLLFISTFNPDFIKTAVRISKLKNILTVSNNKGAPEKGICINFLMDGNKLRFEVNRQAIENANIKPSTRLLSLAVNK